MSGGKGGSATTQVQIPKWLETAAQQNLGRADKVAQIGYVPYMGPDVAALQPGQIAAMQNTGQAASAFGLASPDMMAGMPQAQTFAGGVQGYSAYPLYQESLDALAAARPGQFAALNAPFIDPITGARPAYPFAAGVQPMPGQGMIGQSMDDGRGGGDNGPAGFGNATSIGGYSSFGDMFDGGGPGKSGPEFSGGRVSDIANSLGIDPRGSDGSSGMRGGK